MDTSTTIASLDIEHARALTPGCEHVLHFNNAGASLMPRPVLEASIGQLEREARMGGYEAADHMAQQNGAVYGSIARLIGCHPDEVALAEGSSQAWHKAFHAVPLRAGDRVLTASNEYNSNWLSLLRTCEQRGCSLELVPNDASGQVDVAALSNMLDDRVKLVALTHIATSNGMVNPVEAVGRALRGSNALYLLDACQSIGQRTVDVERIGCD